MAKIASHYRKKDAIVLKMMVGRMTAEELIEQERRQLLHPDFPAAPRVIVDITAVQFESVGEKEIEQMTQLYHEHNEVARGARVAILSTDEYEKARMFETHAQKHGVNVISFNTLETACRWLGLDVIMVRAWMEKTRAELLREPE